MIQQQMDLLQDPEKTVSHTEENVSKMDETVTSVGTDINSLTGKFSKELEILKTK